MVLASNAKGTTMTQTKRPEVYLGYMQDDFGDGPIHYVPQGDACVGWVAQMLGSLYQFGFGDYMTLPRINEQDAI